MGKGVSRFHKHIQRNWTYPSLTTTFVTPPQYVLSPQQDITNYCSAAMIAHHQPSPVLHLTTTNQVDIDANTYGNPQSFTTPIKHNDVTPEIPGTTTKNSPVQPYSNSC